MDELLLPATLDFIDHAWWAHITRKASPPFPLLKQHLMAFGSHLTDFFDSIALRLPNRSKADDLGLMV